MLRNYLLIAIRNLIRQKAYTATTVIGLAVALACAALILAYVRHETGYEGFHERRDRIYRIIRETPKPGEGSKFGNGVQGSIAGIVREIPGVARVARTWTANRWVQSGDKVLEMRVCLADPELFEIFSFSAPGEGMGPLRMHVTESNSRLLFGEEDPIGKVISIQNVDRRGDYQIAGLLDDIPTNTHLRFDMVSSVPSTDYARHIWENWRIGTTWHPVLTYVLLEEGVEPADVARTLTQTVATHLGEHTPLPITYHLQPLRRIHLYAVRDFGMSDRWTLQFESLGDIRSLLVLVTIGAFLLVIACVNFASLTTAQSLRRAREVSLRKAVGAERGQLIRQFLGEAVLVAAVALPLGLACAGAALPKFNELTGRPIPLGIDTWMLLLLGAVTLAAGLGAGSFPAVFLSRYHPSRAFRGGFQSEGAGLLFRKGLVILQFTISVGLIVATLVIRDQLSHMRQKDFGFSHEQVLVSPIFYVDRTLNARGDFYAPHLLAMRYQTVKEAFMRVPGVVAASASRGLPGWGSKYDVVRPEGRTEEGLRMYVVPVDEDFLDLYAIALLEGRNLSADIASDGTQAYLLNETAARMLGWEDPIGRAFEWPQRRERKGRVVGVVRDFDVRPPHEPRYPVVLCMQQFLHHWLSLRLDTDDLPATLAALEEVWGEFVKERPFQYEFLSDNIDERYFAGEQHLEKTLDAASLLGIFVACLGLAGLASYSAERRGKEVGVRKVLGASVSGVWLLLSGDFTRLVAISLIVAWPIAWFSLQDWLSNFAYRIDLGPMPFLLSALIALGFSWLSVGFQAIRAAWANPVEALRYE